MEERTCKETDGLFDPEHEECKNCLEKSRKICEIFSVWHGLRDQKEIIRERKEEEIR